MKAHEFGVEKEEEPELELTSDEAAVVEKVDDDDGDDNYDDDDNYDYHDYDNCGDH